MTETDNPHKETLLGSKESIRNLKKIVMDNKAALYQSRALIEENRMMILSNYSANFMGNRQLINQNTFKEKNGINADIKNTNTLFLIICSFRLV